MRRQHALTVARAYAFSFTDLLILPNGNGDSRFNIPARHSLKNVQAPRGSRRAPCCRFQASHAAPMWRLWTATHSLPQRQAIGTCQTDFATRPPETDGEVVRSQPQPSEYGSDNRLNAPRGRLRPPTLPCHKVGNRPRLFGTVRPRKRFSWR